MLARKKEIERKPMQRKPLQRKPIQRKPIKRKQLSIKEQTPEEKPPKVIKPLAKPAVYARCDAANAPIQKDGEQRNRALLDMAKGRPCLLALERFAPHDASTTVACHSNWGAHGKGTALKAHDFFSVWGCASCHDWLDRGAGPGIHKRYAFDSAMRKQIVEWKRISNDPKEPPKLRLAARWALDGLEATPAGRAYLEEVK